MFGRWVSANECSLYFDWWAAINYGQPSPLLCARVISTVQFVVVEHIVQSVPCVQCTVYYVQCIVYSVLLVQKYGEHQSCIIMAGAKTVQYSTELYTNMQ